ncbi:response regulator [Fervidobacterium nodosum]|uniref:histidine kinase n=1 Tax=Fervidobacterium nodosum (strain ATCC 35602 / DSM 5306 / Rt17-B1) TaxID=381764 RepID=A7HLI2_FERNB|nr:response regulator [Fervidobacterium nodosum]ABS60765.1 CheA signal transduction histidine kinase [Fervidobacterium nodosum Rt17-B1]
MDFLEMFFEELREKGNESINDIKSFLESRDGALINDIYRLFHTIKGSASLVGLVGYKNLFHKIEDYFKSYLAGQGELSDEFLSRLLSIIPPLLERDGDLSESEVQDLIDRLEGKKEAETTIFSKEQGALSVEYIQEFLSMALTTENSLMRGDINSALRIIRLAKSKLTSTIQELYYTKLRNILSNFDTLIVQEATNAKKKVRLNLEIGDEMVEKKDSKALIDILVHLVRNSISHGIESPDERKKIGKDEIGVITIRSYVLNNELYLEVEDDGQGIDFEKVRKKAMERNLGHLRPEDVIFVPGFSTKEEADGTAGRGVGLDAVKNFAMARGGDVEFVTTPGIGTRFIIHFPVKSFLIKVLVLEADGQQFCISTQDVLEIVTKLKAIDGKVKYKDKVCDVVYKSSNPRFGIITRNYRAIFVDNIVGIFDGQVSSESYPSVKGFVKNVYVYPLPIIDIDSFREGEVKKTKKINVLLVDDSVVTRSVVSKFLEAFGYEVIEAKNGSEAISYVESSNCDVVVCDVEMPDIDGFETTRRIKQIKKDLPVILFSTLSKEQLAKGLEVGADAYLSKEESPERLLRLIEKLVG